jgi:hypothetical protein
MSWRWTVATDAAETGENWTQEVQFHTQIDKNSEILTQ